MEIKFAPFNVPWKRRLQTIATAEWFLSAYFGPTIYTLLFVYVWFTSFWWVNLIYLSWMYFDWTSPKKGGYYSPWWLNLPNWSYILDYFPCHTKYAIDFKLDPQRNYLFCCFPHGVLPVAAIVSIVTHRGDFYKKYTNFVAKVAALNILFFIPFHRECALLSGGISCSRQSIEFVLKKPEGSNIVLLFPGGAEEAFHFKRYAFVVKNRKGFVKLALETGTPLVPVVTFGGNEIYTKIENNSLSKFQKYIKKITGVAFVLINGRGFFQYSFGLLPHRKKMTTVLGAPIEVTKEENPTQEQIDELHQKFINELLKLFEEHKHKYLENSSDTYATLL